MACMTAPWICPSSITWFITVPQSCTIVRSSTLTTPVAGSTSTTAAAAAVA